MKKLVGLAIIAILGFTLVGCGNRAPSGVSDEVFEIGSEGLEIVDRYLDGRIDRVPAYNQLDDLIDEMRIVLDDLYYYNDIDRLDEAVEEALKVVTDAIEDGYSYTNEREMQYRRDDLANLLGRN